MPRPQRQAPTAAAPWSRRPTAKSGGALHGLGRVQHLLPVLVFGHLGQCESDLFGRGVQHDKDRRLPLFHRREHIGEESAFRKIPVGFLHFLGRGRQPQHAIGAILAPPIEPALTAELGEAPAQGGHVADEIGEVVALLAEIVPARPSRSRCPGNRRCCCRSANCRPRRRPASAASLREEQAGELVLAQLPAQRNDRGVVGRALMAAIVAVVVVGAVAIVLAVGLVVLLVVAEQVGQRETVMDGDVIDAGARSRGCRDGTGRMRRSCGAMTSPIRLPSPLQ